MSQSTISSLAEFFLVDTRFSRGMFLLPEATSSLGRKVTILDAYGTFSNSTLQVQCSTIDRFEDGQPGRYFSTNNARITFIAASSIWHVLQSNATPAGFNSSNLFYNLLSSPYTLDINSIANISTFNTVNVGTQVAQCNMWVAAGRGANRLKYSLNNGVTWLNCTENFTTYANNVAFNGFMWVAVGNGATSNTIQYSYNGINWSNANGGFASYGSDVRWGGRYWVAVGIATTTNEKFKYSFDGINWSNSVIGVTVNGNPLSLSHNGKIWIAHITDGGGASANAMGSYDGSNWFALAVGPGGTVTYGNYTRGWDGDVFWTATANFAYISSNGIDWFTNSNIRADGFAATTFSNSQINNFVTNGNIVVYNGYGAFLNLKYSKDRFTFSNTNLTFTAGNISAGLAWSGTRFVTGGSNGTANNIAYSDDGITWTTVAGFDTEAQGIAYSSNPIQPFSQSNFNLWGRNYDYNIRSTNIINLQPSTILLNNSMSVDSQNSNVYINTKDGRREFSWDVNGTMRHSIFYSTVTVGGTTTITPGNGFGVHYDIQNAGTYTISLSNTNNTSNIGKFYVFQNNTAGALSVTISGGSGISSPLAIPRFRAARIMVASATTYALF
jgi:hypothetical protein